MSFENRLRHRVVQTAEQLQMPGPIDVERALAGVRTSAARRQKVQVFAVAVAAVAIAVALAAGDNIRNLLFSDDLLPRPADDELYDANVDESDRNNRSDYGVLETEEQKAAGSEARHRVASGGSASNLERAPAGSSDRRTGTFVVADADSKQRSQHTERRDYSVVDNQAEEHACTRYGICTNLVRFRANDTDRWISIKIEDSANQNVSADIYIDTDGDGKVNMTDAGIRICTKTESPIKIRPGAEVLVRIVGAGCPGANPSTGEVVATFTS